MTDQPTDTGYRRLPAGVWWVTLLAPVAATAVALVGVWLTRGWEAVAGVVGLAISSLFLGKFVILGGVDGSAVLLSHAGLAVMVVQMDLMAACWFVFHLDVMRRVPVVGPRFALLVTDGEALLARYPRVRRAAFLSLVVFVMIPFAMTGSVGGAVLARLCGIGRGAAMVAIGIGSVLGAGLMYAVGEAVVAVIPRDNPVWLIGGGLIFVAIILWLNWRYSRLVRDRVETQRSGG